MQGWPPSQVDQRTFADLQARIAFDLNRNDMPEVVQQYALDAMLYYRRKPFFFNDATNDVVPQWQPGFFYTQGATVYSPVSWTATTPPTPLAVYAAGTWFNAGDWITDSNGNYQRALNTGLSSSSTTPTWPTTVGAQTVDNSITWELDQLGVSPAGAIAAVNLTAGVSGTVTPLFTSTAYTVPPSLTSPPIFTPTAGTTVDNQCLWATQVWVNGTFTQLSTVPYQNQYTPPLDFIAPKRVEVVWSGNLRIGMTYLTYEELRGYDVIRPAPPTTYPSYWTWYQEQLFFWPYPIGMFPITLSYRSAPPISIDASSITWWTTKGEGLIRHYTCARILEAVIHDPEAAQNHYALASQELNALTSQRIQQFNATQESGVPPAPW